MLQNDLIQIVHQWDRKNNSILESFYQLYQHQNNCLNIFLDFDTADEKLQDANTWFIKKYLENGYPISNDETDQFISLAKKVSSWGAILHILQSSSYVPYPKDRIIELYTLFKKFIKHDNKFVRAWTYNALYDLSNRYNHNQKETMNLLLEAEKNEAPSVKARIRNILKS